MATIAGLGQMAPTQLTPGRGLGGAGDGGGGNAQEGLGQINSGASTVGKALGTAANAIGIGNGAAGLAPVSNLTDSSASFKKGGKVSSKGRDWHGFGGSKTGNNNHGF